MDLGHLISPQALLDRFLLAASLTITPEVANASLVVFRIKNTEQSLFVAKPTPILNRVLLPKSWLIPPSSVFESLPEAC